MKNVQSAPYRNHNLLIKVNQLPSPISPFYGRLDEKTPLQRPIIIFKIDIYITEMPIQLLFDNHIHVDGFFHLVIFVRSVHYQIQKGSINPVVVDINSNRQCTISLFKCAANLISGLFGHLNHPYPPVELPR